MIHVACLAKQTPAAQRWLLMATLALCLGSVGKVTADTSERDPREYFFSPSFGDLPEELDDARSGGKLGLLLFFEQEGCLYCERMMKTILNQPAVQDWYRERFVSIAIDINGDVPITDVDGVTLPSKVFADHRRVKTTPTLSFLDLNGSEIYRRTKMVENMDEFLQIGRYVSEGHYTDTTWDVFESAQNAGKPEQSIPALVKDLQQEGMGVTDNGQVFVLFITRDGCPYCNQLRREVLRPMVVGGEYDKSLFIRELMMEPDTSVKDFNGSNSSTAEVAARYGVSVTPAVLLLAGSGELLTAPIVGFNNADSYSFRFEKALDEALLFAAKTHVEIKE